MESLPILLVLSTLFINLLWQGGGYLYVPRTTETNFTAYCGDAHFSLGCMVDDKDSPMGLRLAPVHILEATYGGHVESPCAEGETGGII